MWARGDLRERQRLAQQYDCDAADWRRGATGGWLYIGATVAPTAAVFDDAVVLGRVCGAATIRDRAVVDRGAIVGGVAVLTGQASVSGSSRVLGRAQVHGRAVVLDSRVLDQAVVEESAAVLHHSVVQDCGRVAGTAVLDRGVRVSGDAVVLAGNYYGPCLLQTGTWHTPPFYAALAVGHRRLALFQTGPRQWQLRYEQLGDRDTDVVTAVSPTALAEAAQAHAELPQAWVAALLANWRMWQAEQPTLPVGNRAALRRISLSDEEPYDVPAVAD